MKYTTLIPILFLLAACGGGSSTTPTATDVAGGGGTPPTQPTPTPPTQPTPTPTPTPPSGTGPKVVNPLNFTADETFNLFEFETFNIAPVATFPALVDTQIGGTATYNGEMFARMGNGSEFLRGDLRLQTGFQAQTLRGRISQMQFAGDDAAGRGDIPSFDSLDITNGSFSGTELTARLSGTFDEGGFLSLSDPDDEHTVDATLDMIFVDVSATDGGTEFVGTVNGTITSNNDGQRSLVGIVSGDSGF